MKKVVQKIEEASKILNIMEKNKPQFYQAVLEACKNFGIDKSKAQDIAEEASETMWANWEESVNQKIFKKEYNNFNLKMREVFQSLEKLKSTIDKIDSGVNEIADEDLTEIIGRNASYEDQLAIFGRSV